MQRCCMICGLWAVLWPRLWSGRCAAFHEGPWQKQHAVCWLGAACVYPARCTAVVALQAGAVETVQTSCRCCARGARVVLLASPCLQCMLPSMCGLEQHACGADLLRDLLGDDAACSDWSSIYPRWLARCWPAAACQLCQLTGCVLLSSQRCIMLHMYK